MDHHMRITAEAAARLLLRYFQKEHPQWSDEQTPLDEIVSWLGLHVATFYPQDYQEGTYGFVDPDEDENLIWLCRDLSETLRRFTLAHELGHVVLHSQRNERVQALLADLHLPAAGAGAAEDLPSPSRDDPCQESDVEQQMAGLLDQEQFQEALGVGENYDPRSQRELAANIFAAELLMPIERLRDLYLVRRVTPSKLAGIFVVSQAALLNRLAGLLKEPAPSFSTPEVPVSEPSPEPVRKRYDEFQQAAIEAPTPALIVAGPGSGKTSTLIGRIEYVVHTLGVRPDSILALTFSRKAAREMEERLTLALGGAYALPKVSTFHAFCADLLRQHAALAGLRPDFSLIDEAEGYFLLRQMADEMQLRYYQKLQAPAYYFPDMLKAISRAKDELVGPNEYVHLAQRMQEQAQDEEAMQRAEKALEVARVYALYEQGLQRRGDSDFGGLLVLTIKLLHEHPEILQEQQEKYQHILVDEFQDVNRASGVLLRELAGAAQRVWVVGDANQAIYSFRGASPANITNFTSDFPGALVLPLARNYRSRPDLVTLAEAFRCAQLEVEQEPGKNQPVRPIETGAYVSLAKAADEASELAGLIQDIRHKRACGYAYRDMVVLCRTRAQAKKITRTLAAADLPVIERGGMLEQEHVKDALSIALLLANSGGMGLLRAARQPEHPLSQDDIESLLLAAREQKTSPGALLFAGEAPLGMSVQGRHAFNRLSEIMQALLLAPDIWSLLAQYLLVETSLVRDLLCDESKQAAAMLADYDSLLRLARHYDQQQLRMQQREQEDEPGPVERAKGFLEYLSLLVLLRQDGGRQGAEDSAEAEADIIRVMTVHASKGLEFPVVYLPGLVQRRFPSQARSNPVEPPNGMLAPESVGSAAHESGEACLFYVGVTRARDHLVLSYSERYGKLKYKRSPYLDALETSLPADRLTLLHWEPQTVGTPPAIEQQVAQSSQPSEGFIGAMKPATLSASAIEAYHRCPRQYLYSDIYRFENDADAYQLFWQATQRTLESLRGRIGQGKAQADGEQPRPALPTQQEVQELYSQHWQALGGQSVPFAAMYEEHGRAVAEALRRKLTTQEDVRWDMRSSYDVDVAGKTVHVTIDRIETSAQIGEPVKFVRARFGRRKDKPPAELRELFYTLVYRQLHPGQPVELHSHNMSTGEVLPIKLTPRKEQSLYDEIEQSIKGLERNHYPPQPAEPFRCPVCPFFMICPA
jgi:DNA helicase-2/ATP-dependent DNA helicase PcrA